MIAGLGFPMALQFSPDGSGGYLYRKDQVGPGLPATAAERDSYVRWMGWMLILGTILFFIETILLAVIADRFVTSDSNAVGVAGAMVMTGITMGSFYIFLRWASHAPARAFAGRPERAPAKSRKQVFGKQIARMTYTRIVVVTVGMAVFMLLSSRGNPDFILAAVGVPAAIGAGFAIWKWRIETE